MSRDDRRLAAASKVLRHRLRISQAGLVGPGKSRHIPTVIEDGHAGHLRLDDVRAHFARLGATIRVTAWFEGALLDRLIDAEHAEVVEAGVRELQDSQWPVVQTEVTFNKWGERGSIDFLGVHEPQSAALVGEAKSAWGSIEETIRALDVKIRLAPTIVFDRVGWRPRTVGAVLVFPESGSNRRVAQRHASTLLSAFPARNREIRAWLQQPNGSMRGLWFLPIERSSAPSDRQAPPNGPDSAGIRPNGMRRPTTGAK